MIFLSLDFFDAESVTLCSPHSGQPESAEENIDTTDARKRKESVRKELEVAINRSASTNTQFYPGNVFAEAYCIDEFIKRIKLIQTGAIEISETTLINAGFEEAPIDGITIENTTSQDAINFDYAG